MAGERVEEAGVLSGEQSANRNRPIVGPRPMRWGRKMNKDQVKGKAKDIGGKIQEQVGKVVGSSKQQAEGLAKQAEGKVQEKAGDVKEIVKDNRGNR
jgi:uncharacterized protein YjbJ (UPF0337 family)